MKNLIWIGLLIVWGVIFYFLPLSLFWTIIGFVVGALIILFFFCSINLIHEK